MPETLAKDLKSYIFVTGAAGFIGFHVTQRLLDRGFKVLGIDNLNPYYDVRLKEARLEILKKSPSFRFEKFDIADREKMSSIFKSEKPEIVIHLAAQAGVRYSIENPYAYLDSNLTGYLNILEGSRHHGCRHLVYASTSSVYGLSTKMPFSEHDDADHPVSFYGATKRANELMAHSYSSMYGLATTGLRFFTVYGPWGRPDMALFLFTRNMLEGKPIDVFNHGNHKRDFTYVDDIAEGVVKVALGTPPQKNSEWDSKLADPALSSAPYRIFNIGNNRSEALMRYIEVIEKNLGVKAVKNYLPLQAGDVPETHASVQDLEQQFNYHPSTSIEVGIARFIEWYRAFYKV